MSSASNGDILRKIDEYYTGRIRKHGPVPQGVDWNSVEAQETRFEQLVKLLDPAAPERSILDYGCGYGAFAKYIFDRFIPAQLTGYDVSTAMIQEANALQEADQRCIFTHDRQSIAPHDYVVSSGIFSVKMDISIPDWERYITLALDDMVGLARHGIAFNMLTTYSDAERMRPDLYYGDPHAFFDFCRSRYSRNIALLHDYRLYEFTIHVRL